MIILSIRFIREIFLSLIRKGAKDGPPYLSAKGKREAIFAFLLLRKTPQSMREPTKGRGKAKTNGSVAKGESDGTSL